MIKLLMIRLRYYGERVVLMQSIFISKTTKPSNRDLSIIGIRDLAFSGMDILLFWEWSNILCSQFSIFADELKKHVRSRVKGEVL